MHILTCSLHPCGSTSSLSLEMGQVLSPPAESVLHSTLGVAQTQGRATSQCSKKVHWSVPTSYFWLEQGPNSARPSAAQLIPRGELSLSQTFFVDTFDTWPHAHWV